MPAILLQLLKMFGTEVLKGLIQEGAKELTERKDNDLNTEGLASIVKVVSDVVVGEDAQPNHDSLGEELGKMVAASAIDEVTSWFD